MKKFLSATLIALLAIGNISVKADEGMWLPLLLQRLNAVDMQKAGCKLTPEEIYSINHSSLKDAVVQFGNGCTGEIISEQGLLLTNHHCGYGNVQDHSSSTNDYIKNGFWAYNKSEELPNAGLTVSFLVRIEDVSKDVLSQLTDGMSEPDREAKVKSATEQLTKKAIEGTGYRAEIESFFNGNEYYMFVYEVFKDVRLVGVPPYSIGKFGADTDNWMWPRHKGDFCLFRVYTDKNGKPAPYSKDNIPMKPKYALPISMGGVKEGDFSMVMGYPGSTDRYLTSWGVQMEQDITAPAVVKARTAKLQLMKKDMDANNDIFIKYASKYASTSNYWKYYIGVAEQLKKNNVVAKKVAIEKDFSDWINADATRKTKYGNVLSDISTAYSQLSKYEAFKKYYSEGVSRGNELFGLSLKIFNYQKALKEKDANKEALTKKLNVEIEKFFKDFNLATDQKICTALLELYYNNVDKSLHPEYFTKLVAENKNDFKSLVDKLYEKSNVTSSDKIKALIENPELIANDPAYQLLSAFRTFYFKVLDDLKPTEDKLNHAKRLFIAGLREMQPDRKFSPDANFTMRLTYGKVGGYKPKDGVTYDYYTTLAGVMQKEIPNDWEFDVSPKLKELYKKKDYGIYGQDTTMFVNFVTNNDITGGNSGSPVINGKGELIGLAFDGNWEAMSGDIYYEPNLKRTSCVDIRYVLFIIDKFGGAKNLIEEMKLVNLNK